MFAYNENADTSTGDVLQGFGYDNWWVLGRRMLGSNEHETVMWVADGGSKLGIMTAAYTGGADLTPDQAVEMAHLLLAWAASKTTPVEVL